MSGFFTDENARREAFPVCKKRIFLAHAGVTALPKAVADAMIDYTRRSSENHQEFGAVLADIKETRRAAARLIGAQPDEIALLGPTSLGLSLFANGIPWKQGDEVLCYREDYPANVYPWLELRRRGVKVRFLEPAHPGEITRELVESALSPATRLVALASCNFLTGYRINVDAIGAMLLRRGVLFSLDAIQTVGAFPCNVEHVDFLSADAHKWMLGPMAIGIVYVKRKHFDLLRPTLIGAWNAKAPNFIALEEVEFVDTAQRYEPGVLNAAGVYGMKAAIDMFLGHGIDKIAARILELKALLVRALELAGFEIIAPASGDAASGITTLRHPRASMKKAFHFLEQNNVVASLRYDRDGVEYVRLSPHFYNTAEELERTVELLRRAIA